MSLSYYYQLTWRTKGVKLFLPPFLEDPLHILGPQLLVHQESYLRFPYSRMSKVVVQMERALLTTCRYGSGTTWARTREASSFITPYRSV